MNLSTTYLGLDLPHPIVPSASPLSQTLDGIRRMEDAGAPAVVMYSLFEEQIEGESHLLDHYLSYGTESFPEALDYFPELESYNVGPDRYLELIRNAKAATDIPIIGSLNGASTGGWIDYARLIQEAGADALELNIYHIPTDPNRSGAEVEAMYIDIIRSVKSAISIPLAVKVGPYFSAFANMAAQMRDAGADALVLFNRFYQPDFDLQALEVVPNLMLSRPAEMRLPLRWVALLHKRINVDLAITSGVHDAEDVVKGLLAGATVTMTTSALLRRGVGQIEVLRRGLEEWMNIYEYESVEQLRGSMSQMNVAEPDAFERANYMKVLQSWQQDPTGVLLKFG